MATKKSTEVGRDQQPRPVGSQTNQIPANAAYDDQETVTNLVDQYDRRPGTTGYAYDRRPGTTGYRRRPGTTG